LYPKALPQQPINYSQDVHVAVAFAAPAAAVLLVTQQQQQQQQ